MPVRPVRTLVLLTLLASCATPPNESDQYEDLVRLFADWREFERAPMRDGAPDYTAERMASAHEELADYRARLEAIDSSGWPTDQQIDWQIVLAELNGFDFNCRVLKPWARDPAFYLSVWNYQSDVPAHEGPTHHALVEVWQYDFPLSQQDAQRMAVEIATIPPLLEQARVNLRDSNARDLWVGGIRTIRGQVNDLEGLRDRVGGDSGPTALIASIDDAQTATESFADWLEAEAPKKDGPSGIGKENYTWYLQNVHLVPLTWEDEVRLLKRELARAWSSLKLEEHRNRDLSQLEPVTSPEGYDARADAAATRLMTFLDEQKVLPVLPNMEPALREHLGQFVPSETRNFFWITAHLDPIPLYTHFYHWWDLAQIRDDPHQSPIRREALLYNIFDSRAEGIATGVEEMFLHAGLYDGEFRRSREIVWILLAQRAARGLGSLWAHANEQTAEEAGTVHQEWTPRGWMKTEPELLLFEQHLYLRQPGYGTSYITGKFLVEELLAEYGRMKEAQGEEFALRDFFAELNAEGVIPMSLIRWAMTGKDDQVPTR
ncbi:MAG: DUF885 family protein [Planctomycetota bacterium]